MGLFDNFSLDNLDDPKNAGLLAMGLSMLAPKPYKTSFLGDIGQSGMQGLQTLAKAKIDERANRANDIQTLSALQKSIYARELPKMLQQGDSYVPPPDLQAINKSLNDLAIAGNLTGKTKAALTNYAPQSAPTPSASPAPMPPPGPINQSFAGANSGFDPSSLGRAPGQMPPQMPPQAPPQMPPQAPQQQGAVPQSLFGVPMSAFAAASMAGNQGVTDFLKAAIDARKPVNGRPGGTMVGYDDKGNQQMTYLPKLETGMTANFGPGGGVNVGVAPGYLDSANAINRTTAGATQAGKQAETFGEIDIGGGQKMRMTNGQFQTLVASGWKPGQPLPPAFFGQSQSIPQSVIDADRRNQPFNATQSPDGNVQFQPPSAAQVAKVTPLYQGGNGGASMMGGLGITPNPVAQAGAMADATTSAKNRQNVMKADYETLSNESNSAQTIMSRLQTIKQLGPEAITGAFSEKRDLLNGLLSLVNIKPAIDAKTASDLVDKNAAQIALAIGAGSNGTDSLRSLAQIANPGRKMNLESMQKAADSVIAPIAMKLDKNKMLTPYFTNGDAQGYLTNKQTFEHAADPRVWELQAMEPQAQQAYVKSLSPSDAKALLNKRTILRQIGVIQ